MPVTRNQIAFIKKKKKASFSWGTYLNEEIKGVTKVILAKKKCLEKKFKGSSYISHRIPFNSIDS